MDDLNVKIDYRKFNKVYDTDLYKAFKKLGVTHFIDINKFIERRKLYPNITSIWEYGNGGDYDFEYKELGNVHIHGGTIALIESYGVIPFGDRYYQAHFGVPMIDQGDYNRIQRYFDTPGSIIDQRKVISFQDVGNIIQNGQVVDYGIEPQYQKWARGDFFMSPENSIVTLIDRNGQGYLVKAYYDSQTNQIFPPKKR